MSDADKAAETPDHIWIVGYRAAQDAGSLSRGVYFRSIHNSREEAEKMRHPLADDFIITEYQRTPEGDTERGTS